MMFDRLWKLIATGIAFTSTGAHAQQVIELTPTSNVAAVLNLLKPGDTLRVTGVFNSTLRLRNRDFGGMTIDASQAILSEGVHLQNVQNANFKGGIIGRTDADTRDWATLRIDNSLHISVSGTTVIGNGNMRGAGIRVTGSEYTTIRDNNLSGHLGSIVLISSNNSLITRNNMTQASSDGINVVDSQRVLVSSNRCHSFTPGPGAHADCIQLWSLAGKPLQSDIFVINNSAIGNIQAFLSSDPKTESGTRITFAGNYAAVSTTHTITCGNCTNSVAFENVLANLPNAIRGAGSLKFGPSPTNLLYNNQFFDLRGRTDGWMPTPTWTSFVPFIAGQVGSQWDNRSFGFQLTSNFLGVGNAVPEPASWLLFGLGFAAVGRTLRQMRSDRHGLRRVLA